MSTELLKNTEKLADARKICTERFLVPCEGYARKLPNGDCAAYPDPATGGDPWTIGYGSTFDDLGVKVKQGDIWTKEKAISVKQIVLTRFLNELLKYSPNLINQSSLRIAAVLSWYYNLGPGNYRVSTFKKKVDEENWMEAAIEGLKWDKAAGRKMKGLTIRRQLEMSALLLDK